MWFNGSAKYFCKLRKHPIEKWSLINPHPWCAPLTEHAEYIDVFCSDFEKVLTSMIDNGIEAKAEQDIKDSLALETMGHAQFAMQKCAMFHGRGEFLKQLKSKITLPKNR